MPDVYAAWYDEVPEGDFISKAPTYRVGELFGRFHEGKYVYKDVSMKYYWYDPREYGAADNGKLTLLTFLHGTSNALVGDVCINYTGAELYASDAYQETLGGAFILIPVANEYRDEDDRLERGVLRHGAEHIHHLTDDAGRHSERKQTGVGKHVAEVARKQVIYPVKTAAELTDDVFCASPRR